MEFLNRHAGAVQAVAAMLTAVLALGALIGVKIQIDAADRIQRAQSARDIYREFLSLSVANPKFSQPDHCALTRNADAGAYESYVNYLLYSAEQLLAVDAEWGEVLKSDLEPHAALVCEMSEQDVEGHSDAVQSLVLDVRAKSCAAIKTCD